MLDGSAIVTKQLQQDGTSKTIVYKPTKQEEVEKQTPKYITIENLADAMQNIDDIKQLKDEIKNLKSQVKDLAFDFNKKDNKKG